MLESRQVLYEQRGKFWKIDGGLEFLLLHKRPAIANPLTPFRPLFHASWYEDIAERDESPKSLDDFFAAIRPLQVLVALLFVTLLGALPVVSYFYGDAASLLAVFGTHYALTIVACGIAMHRRVAIGIEKGALVKILVEVLLCAPLSVNLVRKLSAQYALPCPPLRFALREFDLVSLEKLVLLLRNRVEEALLSAEDGSFRHARLLGFRSKLQRLER